MNGCKSFTFPLNRKFSVLVSYVYPRRFPFVSEKPARIFHQKNGIVKFASAFNLYGKKSCSVGESN